MRTQLHGLLTPSETTCQDEVPIGNATAIHRRRLLGNGVGQVSGRGGEVALEFRMRSAPASNT